MVSLAVVVQTIVSLSLSPSHSLTLTHIYIYILKNLHTPTHTHKIHTELCSLTHAVIEVNCVRYPITRNSKFSFEAEHSEWLDPWRGT